MRRLILAIVLAVGLIIPGAIAADGTDWWQPTSSACGPDPAFGYRTPAGVAAARAILTDLGYADHIAGGKGIDGGAVIARASAAQLVVLAGFGFFGDAVTHPYPVDYSAFSGIVGVSDGDITYYAVRFGKIVGTEPGTGTTDTAALYVKYLGSAVPTLAGVPCPVVTIVAPTPTSAVSSGVIARLRIYIARLTACACNPVKLALYQARLDVYLSR